ncbi:MAG TPA: FAD-binding oxidoreductase [Candidatus Nanoperiomorbaceae bacterium]|nr:FAD-binding oxidoreductase [Candidatus Nanoperiomorbaceae bacterium]HMU11903.1 FAD-binding oxidoreductase [Candidatus Nanoperiomorbaceae bacterium]
MSKIADYLRERLTGEVSAEPAVRKRFATDGSVLQMAPQIVVYPRTTNDVRKLARFTWRLAERGQVLPIVPRGSGTDTTGAAIGSGAVVVFPAHMARILELDIKSQMVRVQPGLNLATLQEAMATHGLFLPPVPSDFKASTVGGAFGCNAAGTKSIKYGTLRDWTDRLEIVLANGEIIQTGRISKHELNAKKGLQTMEGEIYRSLDNLIEDNQELIQKLDESNTPNASGYALELVKAKDGSFDLTPLVIGSQGTLGVIVQAILKLTNRPTEVSMMAAAITGEQDLPTLTEDLLQLEPSELEFIDGGTLELIEQLGGGTPWKTVTDVKPVAMVFIEFDDRNRARKVKKAAKLLESAGVLDARVATEWEDQESLRSIHHSVSTITNYSHQGTSALPLAPDIAVEPSKVPLLVEKVRGLLRHHHIEGGVWGHLGTGVISVRPLINLANLGQRQIVFKFISELAEAAADLGGSLTGEFGEGRMASVATGDQNGQELTDLFVKVKQIFDPYGTLNPGVKSGSDQQTLLAHLRQEYNQSGAEFNLRG